MNCLHPIHKSMSGKRGFVPRNMDRWEMPSSEHKDAAINIALSIFVDCSNVGTPFQESLLAIYLSGLHHGYAIAKDKEDLV